MATIVATLLTSMLLAAAPAMAEQNEGINCRVISRAGVVARGGTYIQQVGCAAGLVLTGGGQSCVDPNQASVNLLSSTFPDGDPANWICTWENQTLAAANCQCDAICCSMTPAAADPLVCEHDECLIGFALDAGPPACSSCVATVCACDSYCCDTSWDAICIHEAQELCGLSCGSVASCVAGCGCP